jgi:hypothetical protein
MIGQDAAISFGRLLTKMELRPLGALMAEGTREIEGTAIEIADDHKIRVSCGDFAQ